MAAALVATKWLLARPFRRIHGRIHGARAVMGAESSKATPTTMGRHCNRQPDMTGCSPVSLSGEVSRSATLDRPVLSGVQPHGQETVERDGLTVPGSGS